MEEIFEILIEFVLELLLTVNSKKTFIILVVAGIIATLITLYLI